MERAAWTPDPDGRFLEVSLLTDDALVRLFEIVELKVELNELSGLMLVEGTLVSFQKRGDNVLIEVDLTGTLLPESA